MTDTLWADVSEFQVGVTDQYPYRGFAFRSNDGTYRDRDFALNLAWAKHACDTGRMDFFIVYFVYEENWQQTIATLKAMVGKPHPKMAVMIDVESWSGKIRGNQSATLNACRAALASWLGGYMSLTARVFGKHKKRVIGYANAGDFATLWPNRPSGLRVVLANYSANPAFPGKLAHQFSSTFNVPPFGKCDINSADGLSPVGVVKALGLDPTTIPAPAPAAPNPIDGKELILTPADKAYIDAKFAALQKSFAGAFSDSKGRPHKLMTWLKLATGKNVDVK